MAAAFSAAKYVGKWPEGKSGTGDKSRRLQGIVSGFRVSEFGFRRSNEGEGRSKTAIFGE